LPIITYRHDGGDCSVTGGYRYRGFQYPQLQGVYFYADYCTGRVHTAVLQANNWNVDGTTDTSFTISTFGEDENGELYLADHGGGVIYRVEGDHPAPTLSSLSPSKTPAGSAAFSLTVKGSTFVPGASVTWNGAARETTFVDNNTLQAAITGADL